MTEKRRIVITGIGAVTPIGLNVSDFWENLVAGKSGSKTIERFDASQHKCKVAAEIRDFDPTAHFERKEVKNYLRFVQYALVAAREAMADAGLKAGEFDANRAGCLIGTGCGGLEIVEEQALVLSERGARRVTPFLITKLICNGASGYVSIDLGLKGPNTCVVTACATGTHAIGDAAAIISRGEADIMVCGGTEAAITPLSIAGFANMGALTEETENPETASRPFDKTRSGFVMGEGAGVLVVESLDNALRRGAPIHAEVIGYGMTGDAYHITAPGPGGEGGARALKAAIDSAGLEATEVDYVNAHGTSTPLNDKLETDGIKSVFGDHAYRLKVSSNKSMIGHLIGAAGAVEAIATIQTIKNGVIPPTINYREPDPECDLDYVPNEARKAEVNVAASSSLGFGGHNCSIVLRKYGV